MDNIPIIGEPDKNKVYKCCPIEFVIHVIGDRPVSDVIQKKVIERSLVQGFAPCPEAQEKLNQGYVALIGARNVPKDGSALHTKDADRTGKVLYIPRETYNKTFPPPLSANTFYVFLDEKNMDYLFNLIKIRNAETLIWRDPNPMETHDYRITEIKWGKETSLIVYNSGRSELEVPNDEIEEYESTT